MSAGRTNQRWEKAIEALLACATHRKAAARAGIAERTLRDYLADPEFMALYREARRRIVESAIGRLQRASQRAVATLVAKLKCNDDAVAVRAAKIIVDAAVSGVELSDLAARVEELERGRPRLASTGRRRAL